MLSQDDQIQGLEYDHSPNPDLDVCPQCGQKYIAEAGITKSVWEGKEEVTYFFCSTHCSREFYLEHLREGL